MRSSPIRFERSGMGTSSGLSLLPRHMSQGQPASSSPMDNASDCRAGSMYSDQVVLDSNRCWSTSMVCSMTCPPTRRVPAVVPPRRPRIGGVLVDAAADLAQPVVRGLPRRIGLAPLFCAELPGGRIRAEELHAGQAGMEIAQT